MRLQIKVLQTLRVFAGRGAIDIKDLKDLKKRFPVAQHRLETQVPNLANRDTLVNHEQDFHDVQDFQDEGSDAPALLWQATGYSMHQHPKILLIVIILQILLISCSS